MVSFHSRKIEQVSRRGANNVISKPDGPCHPSSYIWNSIEVRSNFRRNFLAPTDQFRAKDLWKKLY